jgi:hypothetical protein
MPNLPTISLWEVWNDLAYNYGCIGVASATDLGFLPSEETASPNRNKTFPSEMMSPSPHDASQSGLIVTG